MGDERQGQGEVGAPAEGRIAVVTGASSGIGESIARELSRRGWALHLTGRDEARLERLRSGGSVQSYAGDLTSDEFVVSLGERLPRRVDALVHSAGMVSLGRFDEARVEDLDHQYRLNVRAPYLLTQRLLPALRAARGTVVFINSGAGLRARGEWGQYAASKHALKALADSLREEEPDLRVSTVYPGRTASPMQESVHRMEGRDYRPESFVRPADIAAQVALLLELPWPAVVTDVSIRPG